MKGLQLKPVMNWKSLRAQGQGARGDKGTRHEVKTAIETGQKITLQAFAGLIIPSSKHPKCHTCGAYHNPIADCMPSKETQLKVHDEMNRQVGILTKLSQSFDRASGKGQPISKEDSENLAQMSDALKRVTATLGHKPTRSTDRGRSQPRDASRGRGKPSMLSATTTSDMECYAYLRGDCQRGDACRFKHEPGKEGSDAKAGASLRQRGRSASRGPRGRSESRNSQRDTPPICRIAGCGKATVQRENGNYHGFCSTTCLKRSQDEPDMVQERVHQAEVRAKGEESDASFMVRMQEYCMDAA